MSKQMVSAPEPKGALVIGANYRALGIIRSLGRNGIPVWTLKEEHAVAAYSRYSKRSLPWPATNQEDQFAYLQEIASKYGLEGWTLFPTSDEDTALIACHHEILSQHYLLTTPPIETIEIFRDKRRTYQCAAKLGIQTPWTLYPHSREEVEQANCTFPVILKPAIREGFNPFVHAKAWRVDDRASLLARYDEACQYVSRELIMIQECIPGGGECQFSYAALCKDGKPLAHISACRARQYPIDFGRSSTYVESIDLPEVGEISRRLLESIGYTGLIELEFKRDPRNGIFKLLDINPRVWGWHSIGRRAGVDFPYLLWQLIHGEPVQETSGRNGVRWIRMLTDIPAAVREWRSGSLSLREYLKSFKHPVEFATFAFDDPLPGLIEVPYLLALGLKRGAF